MRGSKRGQSGRATSPPSGPRPWVGDRGPFGGGPDWTVLRQKGVQSRPAPTATRVLGRGVGEMALGSGRRESVVFFESHSSFLLDVVGE